MYNYTFRIFEDHIIATQFKLDDSENVDNYNIRNVTHKKTVNWNLCVDYIISDTYIYLVDEFKTIRYIKSHGHFSDDAYCGCEIIFPEEKQKNEHLKSLQTELDMQKEEIDKDFILYLKLINAPYANQVMFSAYHKDIFVIPKSLFNLYKNKIWSSYNSFFYFNISDIERIRRFTDTDIEKYFK